MAQDSSALFRPCSLLANWRTFLLGCMVPLLVSPPDSGLANSENMATPAILPLSQRFTHPPSEFRILKIIHNWPDPEEAQDRLIEKLKTQGFGGVVCNVSFTDYLESDAKWQAFIRAVQAARQAGFAMWLYDEKGYPSASAGGLVLKDHPEWEARGLLIADQQTDGSPVSLSLPPGKSILTAAFPVQAGLILLHQSLDLSDCLQDRTLSWKPKPGRWHVMAITEHPLYDGTHAELNLHAKQPYPNLLQKEPTARFLELTHDQYARRLDHPLGEWFLATFTDEPSLMSLFLRPMPYRALPWSSDLPAQFAKRRGYDLLPLLPALVAEAGPAGRRARYDFWLTIGELVSENFFGQIQQWCAAHQIPSGGHLLMEESLPEHVPLYGDFFRCLRRLDAPSIDCLTSIPAQVPWFIARLVASAAELEGRSLTMCETSDHAQRYRPPGDNRPKLTVSEADIRGTCNRLLVSGVNAITSYYSFAGLDDQTLQHLNEWVGRCSLMLRGGHQVADVAVLYPVDSLWPTFRPAQHRANDAPQAFRIQTAFRAVAENLFAARRDFTFVDARTLAEAKVENGALRQGNLRWRVVVLPGADTLPWAAWENLQRFAHSGGVIVTAAARPTNSEKEFPAPAVQALGNELFGHTHTRPFLQTNQAGGAGLFLPAGTESLLSPALDQILEADVQVRDRKAPLRSTHRRIDGQEIYFLINDSPEPWSGSVRLCAAGPGEIWFPATGKTDPIQNPREVTLNLEPYGAVLCRFPEARSPARYPIRNGVLPGLSLRQLPAIEPLVGKGEFVEANITRATAPGDEQTVLWRAAATLTRGQVDTWLFLRFPCAQTAALRGAECFVLDTWVPAGQGAQLQLLVILHEKSGADYLAHSSCLLSAPGRQQSFLALDQFQLAGWAKDDNSRLDLDQIDEIRIGWGGYLGKEGERIEFRTALPQWGVLE